MRLTGRVAVLAVVILSACDGGSGTGTADGGDDATVLRFDGGGGEGEDGAAGGNGGGGGQGGDTGLECLGDPDCTEGYYCRFGPDALPGTEGLCSVGCRLEEGACGAEYVCDEATRQCVLDPRCTTDEECLGSQYCDDGLCAEGCRTTGEDTCARGPAGEPFGCDPGTHACVAKIICCDAADACSEQMPGGCAAPLAGAASCVNPNPCENRCRVDGECGALQYCDTESGYCAEGCRLQGMAGCPADTTCDAETRACLRRRCAEDGDCAAIQFCDPDSQECVRGCRQAPDNCAAGLICSSARICGDGCEDDAQCAARNGEGFYCEAGGCRRPCGAPADCEADEVCDVESGRCEAGCRDDGFEDNDVRDRARALAFDGLTFASGNTPLYVCPQDRDFYSFQTPEAGWGVEVAVRFRQAGGDIDARLYDPAGNVVARGEGNNDDEVLTYPAAAAPSPAGTWIIEVYGRGVATNTYSLEIDLSAAGACLPDAAEAGRGDGTALFGQRLSLPGLSDMATLQNRSICPGDEDWLTFRMGDRDGLTVRLDILGNARRADDGLDFEIYGPGAPGPDAPPAFVPNSAGGDPGGPRVIQFDAPANNAAIVDGSYYVRIFGLDERQTAQYTVSVVVDRERPLCEDDVAEPNDARQEGYDLMNLPALTRARVDGAGRELVPDVDLLLPDLWLCGGEEDWFRITLSEGDALAATIVRDEAVLDGDTRVEIRDANGARVGTVGRNGQARNTAFAEELVAGTYYVWTASVGDTQSHYTLQLNRVASMGMCTPDRLEAAGNETRADAEVVPVGRTANLTLCGGDGDSDWYSFQTDAQANVTVAIRFAQVQGDLDLDIYRGNREISENLGSLDGHSAANDEVVRLLNVPADRYFVEVSGVGAANARYDLEVNVQRRAFLCVDDEDEPNDTLEQAISLGNGALDRVDQWICEGDPRDEDWFQIDVPGGTQRTLATTFLYGQDGDLYLEVYDADQMLRATTGSLRRENGKQCVIIDALAGQERSFWVRAVPLAINNVQEQDERLEYRLRVLDGDVCDELPPNTPGVDWPHIED